MSENARRAEYGNQVMELAASANLTDDDELETDITDLITNLLHYAHTEGLNTEEILTRAGYHFTQEIEEES